MTFVRRNPALIAAVAWFLLGSAANRSYVGRHVTDAAWATGVQIFVIADALVFAVALRRWIDRPGVARVRWPLILGAALLPIVSACGLAYLGASRWSLGAAWIASGVLLGWAVVTVAAEERAHASAADNL